MTTNHMTTVMDAVAVELAKVTGVPTGGVLRVGQFAMGLVGRTADTEFPRILLKLQERTPISQYGGANRPIRVAMQVAILAIDNGRTTTDQTWSADRAEALEYLIDKALCADMTLGGNVQDIEHKATRYNPEMDGIQVDTSVLLVYEIRTQVRYGDLSSNKP